MKILHLLTSGESGGIESLCRDIGRYGKQEHAFCLVTKGGVICEQMRYEGRTVFNLEQEGGKFSIRKLKHLKAISKNYDVIIVHHGDPFLKLYYILLKKMTNIYGVTMVHSCYGDESQVHHRGLKKLIYESVFQKCFDVSDAIWFVSRAGLESCRKVYQVAEGKSRIIYNGIAPEFLKKASENQVSAKVQYQITYIGRLEKVKGIGLLIQAFADVVKDRDVVLSIVGDGTERTALETQIARLHLTERVQFHGQQLDVSGFLRQTAIFVYPSTCQEVFGISLVEAMAHGIPCIANAVGGIPEIIKNDENGFLTEEPSAEEIARLIRKVICLYENGQIEVICQKAKETAQSFSIADTCDRMEQELEKGNQRCRIR